MKKSSLIHLKDLVDYINMLSRERLIEPQHSRALLLIFSKLIASLKENKLN